MKEELLTFKGVKEGIYVNVDSSDLDSVLEELKKKLKASKNFYKGTKILGVKSDKLSDEDKYELMMILKYRYDFKVSDEDMPKYLLEEPQEEVVEIEPIIDEKEIIEDIEDTKFIHGTLRSGQVVSHSGNIIVIGDINPGALVEAGGNIVVLGILRGVAHAGKGGNDSAIVAAYKLNPTQLRISDKIARSPDEDINSIVLPEIAKIKNDEVYIEPYLPNK